MIIPEEGKPLTAAPLTPSWHAERTPEAPAIAMGATGETVSYAQLEDRSARLARALRARGLAEGDTVAICMGNNRQYLEVAWAAQRSAASRASCRASPTGSCTNAAFVSATGLGTRL
jgi:long-chain acyl-CoA synthetase